MDNHLSPDLWPNQLNLDYDYQQQDIIFVPSSCPDVCSPVTKIMNQSHPSTRATPPATLQQVPDHTLDMTSLLACDLPQVDNTQVHQLLGDHDLQDPQGTMDMSSLLSEMCEVLQPQVLLGIQQSLFQDTPAAGAGAGTGTLPLPLPVSVSVSVSLPVPVPVPVSHLPLDAPHNSPPSIPVGGDEHTASSPRQRNTGARRERRHTQAKRIKLYDVKEKFPNRDQEKRRLDAINSKKNRERNKKEREELQHQVEHYTALRDKLQNEVQRLRHQETQLQHQLCPTPPHTPYTSSPHPSFTPPPYPSLNTPPHTPFSSPSNAQ